MTTRRTNSPLPVGTIVRFRRDGDIGILNELERPYQETGWEFIIYETVREPCSWRGNDHRSVIKSLLNNGGAYHPILLEEVRPPDDIAKAMIKKCKRCRKNFIGKEDICAMCRTKRGKK